MGRSKSKDQEEKMSFDMIIRPRAEENTNDAFLWYESRLKGLGEEFLLSADACINFIKRNPLAFQEKYKNVRVGLMDRFPYGIFYIVDRQTIIVLAVLYLSRNQKLFQTLH